MKIRGAIAGVVGVAGLSVIGIAPGTEALARCDHGGNRFDTFSHSHPHGDHTHNWYFHRHETLSNGNHRHLMHNHSHGGTEFDWANFCPG